MKNSYLFCVCTHGFVHTCRLPGVKVRRHHLGVSSSSRLARQCPACCFCCVYVLRLAGTSALDLFSCVHLVSHHGNAGIAEAWHHIQLFMWVPGNPVVGMAWHTIGCWAVSWPHKVFIRWLCSNLISFCLLKAKITGHWLQLLSSLHSWVLYCPFLPCGNTETLS